MKKALLDNRKKSVHIILAFLGLVISAVLNITKAYNTTPFALLDVAFLCCFLGFLPVWGKAKKELLAKRFEEGCFSLLAFFICTVFAFVYAFHPSFLGKANYFPFLASVPLFFFLLNDFWNSLFISFMTDKTKAILPDMAKVDSPLSMRPLTGNGEITQEVSALKKPFFPLFPLAALLLLFIFLGNGLPESAMLRCAALFASVPPVLTYFAEKPYLTLQFRAINKGFLLFDGALEKAEKVNLSVLTVENGLSEGNLYVERVYTQNVPEKDVLLMTASFYGGEDAVYKALTSGLNSALITADEYFKHSEKDAFFARYDGKTYAVARSYDLNALGLSCSEAWLHSLPKTKTLIALAEEGTVIGFVALSDTIRSSAQTALEKLNAITETCLLTQESSYIAKTTAKQLGMKKYTGELSAAQINDMLEQLALEGSFILYTGRPPKHLEPVALSVNANGDTEAYDVVLLNKDLNLLPEMLTFSKTAIFRLKFFPLIRLALATVLSAICLTGAVSPLICAFIGLLSAVAIKLFH